MTQKKLAPKRIERSSAKKRTRSLSNEEEESDERSTKDRRTKSTQRVERVEHSSLKKRARTPSEEEEESDERNKKERRSNKNKLADTTRKTALRNERRRLKGRFNFRSVDFFTNILLIEIMIANPNQ